MQLSALLNQHGRELARAVRNHHYDVSPAGIHFPRQGLIIGGSMETWLNGRDHQIDPNIIPTEGLTHIISVVACGGTQIGTWYVRPFAGNVTPLATWTAANYTANSTEFTNYTGDGKAFVESAAAAGATSNSASKASFAITGSATVYGAALMSVATKSAITGTLLAAALFSPARAVVNGDVLEVQYNLSGTSS